jgi:HD-GYP domain-containing protein (c-di-GMP phosphodiesterase class II)
MEDKEFEKIAKGLINSFALVIKTAQIHHINNVAVVNAIQKFLSFLNPILSSEAVTIELVGEFFHLNNSRVRYSMEYIFNFEFLIEEFKKKRLGTIIFEEIAQEEDIKTLVNAIISSSHSVMPFHVINKELEKVPYIHVKELRKISDDHAEFEKKKLIKRSYLHAAALTKDITHRVKAGEMVSLKRPKRTIGTIIDQLVEDESMLIGMTTIKDYDEYTHYHSVNVSILSMALGHKLGLSRKVLANLGLAGLLHDIGKIQIPIDVLNKPTSFTDGEWQLMKQHPAHGALVILRIKEIDDSLINLVIPSFEHHLNYDLTGYPKLRHRVKMDFFSSIIAIADQYDASTSSRVYSRVPLSPERALSTLLDKSGTQVDPYLLKVFINMIGIYPIGSLVVLNTNEMGLVFENNTNPDLINRPRVLIISNSSGERIPDKNTAVDLTEKDENGDYKRSITKTLDPNQYGINLAEYLL